MNPNKISPTKATSKKKTREASVIKINNIELACLAISLCKGRVSARGGSALGGREGFKFSPFYKGRIKEGFVFLNPPYSPFTKGGKDKSYKS